MNRELRGLLAAAGYKGALDADAWKNAVVFRNAGAVPPPPGVPVESGQKGFKLLLLDRRGRVTHVARCGAPADPAFERESLILETLCTLPALARTIPHSQSACSSRLRLQLSTYIPGPSYKQIVGTQNPDAWARSACEILRESEAVTQCAEDVLPGLLAGGEQLSLADEVVARLQLLKGAGIPSLYLQTLEQALSSVPPLQRRLQHGDLWPGNVLRHEDSWWLIDFAEFGHAQVPMYDVFLLVHHTWLMLGFGIPGEHWKKVFRQVVAVSAGRLGLTAKEAAATMIYYLVHLSCYRLRHGAYYVNRAPFLGALLNAAESLRAGCALENLALPWEEPAL